MSESESEDEDEAEDSSLGSGRGCAFFAVFAGTRTTTWLGVSESDEESSDEDDSEDETAARRLRFRVRFLTAKGLGWAGAMVKQDEPEDVVKDEENASRRARRSEAEKVCVPAPAILSSTLISLAGPTTCAETSRTKAATVVNPRWTRSLEYLVGVGCPHLLSRRVQ